MKITPKVTNSSVRQGGMQRTRMVGTGFERGDNQTRGHRGALANVQTLDAGYDFTAALGNWPVSLVEMLGCERQAPRPAVELRWPRHQGDPAQRAAAMTDIRDIVQRVLEELDALDESSSSI